MKKINALAFVFLFLTTCGFAATLPGLNETVVVVDKKTNKIHLTNYNDGALEIIKTFRATFGKSVGDKLMEGDLKTPEGIYDFLYKAEAPKLKPIFGPLAVYIGYPNTMDKSGAKTGFDILLHGTDDPARLERPFDSKGCVVTDNENVKFISEFIKMRETKVIITKDFSQLQSNPRMAKMKEFFDRWIKAWSGKDLTTYIESYADEFRMDGMNRLAYAKYKESLNKKYETITVTPSEVRFYLHEKYDLITFTQNYKSTMKGGVQAYNGTSKKNLYLQERNGEYRIIVEENQK